MVSMFKVADKSAYPAPDAVYNWRIYMLAVSAAMGSSMFGYDSAFIGGNLTLPSFKSRFGLASADPSTTAALSANIVSTFQAGCFFGAILVSYFAERLGRRIPLMKCGAIFNIGAVLQLMSDGNIDFTYAGRALTGLAVGASSLVVPQYISEWSPPAIRDISDFGSTTVSASISHRNRMSSGTFPLHSRFVPGSLLVVLMRLQPESPRWLIKAGMLERATGCMSPIRGLPQDDAYIAYEISTIQAQLEREADLGAQRSLMSKIKEAVSAGDRHRLFLGMSLMMLQNLSGINALNYYSPTIFKSIGFTGTNVGLLATGVFGIIKYSATVLFMLFGIDCLGGRKAIIIGSAGAIAAMYYLGSYTALSKSFSQRPSRDGGAYVAIVMIYLFSVFYAIPWNGVPWIFCAEVFPTGIRSVCLVFTTCTQWLGQFIIVYSTPYMVTRIDYGTFLFFGSSVVVGVSVVYNLMPETQGLSLEEMDVLFKVDGSAINKRRKADEIINQQRDAEQIASAIKPEKHHFEVGEEA